MDTLDTTSATDAPYQHRYSIHIIIVIVETVVPNLIVDGGNVSAAPHLHSVKLFRILCHRPTRVMMRTRATV